MTDMRAMTIRRPSDGVSPKVPRGARPSRAPAHPPARTRPGGVHQGSVQRAREIARAALPVSRRLWASVAAIVACGTGLRLWLILRGWPRLDSDVAIIGLMARHILYAGERPVFYYGQHYMGALDAYVAAGSFAILGPTPFALAVSTVPLSIGFLLLAFWLGRAVGGVAVGLMTLTYFALGPALALYLGGAYPPFEIIVVFGAVLCWLVYRRLRDPRPLPRGPRSWMLALALYGAFGIVAGLGIWSDVLLLVLAVAGIIVLAIGRPRELFNLPGLALVAGVVVGGWPFLAYNVQHGWASFAELAAQSRPATQHGLLPSFPALLGQLGGTLAVGIPVTLGSPRVCVGQGMIWNSYPPTLATLGASALCTGLNALFAACVLGCYAAVAWPIGVHATRRLRVAARARSPRATLRAFFARTLPPANALRVMLLLVALGTLGLYTLSDSARTNEFTASRYLIPLYLTVPLIFAAHWGLARPGILAMRSRLAAHYGQARVQRLGRGVHARGRPAWSPTSVWRRATSGAAAGAMLLMLAFAAYGTGATITRALNTTLYATPVSPRDQALLETLNAHAITRFTSDYWTCFRIAFESGERIRCAVRSQNGPIIADGAVNRYPPYTLLLEQTRFPAYIVPAGGTLDRGFTLWATSHDLPHIGYLRVASGEYAVYYYAEPGH